MYPRGCRLDNGCRCFQVGSLADIAGCISPIIRLWWDATSTESEWVNTTPIANLVPGGRYKTVRVETPESQNSTWKLKKKRYELGYQSKHQWETRLLPLLGDPSYCVTSVHTTTATRAGYGGSSAIAKPALKYTSATVHEDLDHESPLSINTETK